MPPAASRPIARLGRLLVQMAGAEIPPLNDVVQSFSVEQDHVLARLKLPRERLATLLCPLLLVDQLLVLVVY